MERYGQPDPNCVYGLERDDNGQWVRYEDVAAALAATSAPVEALTSEYAEAVRKLAEQQDMSEVNVLRAAIRLYQAERNGTATVEFKREMSMLPATSAPSEPAPIKPMDEDDLQEFCSAHSFEQDDYTTDVIRTVEARMQGIPQFVPADPEQRAAVAFYVDNPEQALADFRSRAPQPAPAVPVAAEPWQPIEPAAFMEAVDALCAETLKAGYGVAVKVPDNIRAEMVKFMHDEPSMFDRLPYDAVVKLSTNFASLAAAPWPAPAVPVAAESEDKLHAAICHAVSIMNNSFDIARSAEGREANDILRRALLDYADAPSAAQLVGVRSTSRILPTYFVQHPDGSYTPADPQPEPIVMFTDPPVVEYTPPGPLQWEDGDPAFQAMLGMDDDAQPERYVPDIDLVMQRDMQPGLDSWRYEAKSEPGDAPAAQPEVPAELSEREAFEKWAESNGFSVHRDETEKYREYHRTSTRFAREGWLAALPIATPPAEVVVPAELSVAAQLYQWLRSNRSQRDPDTGHEIDVFDEDGSLLYDDDLDSAIKRAIIAKSKEKAS